MERIRPSEIINTAVRRPQILPSLATRYENGQRSPRSKRCIRGYRDAVMPGIPYGPTTELERLSYPYPRFFSSISAHIRRVFEAKGATDTEQ
ncbi:hypothetical protein O1611_g945 [Lasiodiplodia mahajangana]|uniref:Uncharacterized protein n=1 Tax=Lasiodiplodia mahajangana TaxID=1108764 RepID=A0ACC2JYW9_9PEZI|nr:hypothetical protein O1611_g945 [Lasiodiplodia mahajangana]